LKRYLELWQLGKSFPGKAGAVPVVRGFDLVLAEGEFVCLIGHSGCGKSTVLSMAAGLVTPTEGGITVAGREVQGPGTDRGVVFQSPALLPWLTAFENVMLGIDQVFAGKGRSERERLATDALARVGLEDDMQKTPAALSGGMRQRVGIARALAISPKVLLLDEPFGMLDSLTRLELQELLLDVWSRDRTTALMVTHDVDEALFLSDRVAMMTSGPEARLGDVLEIPFPRPRHRTEVLEHPRYDELRERIIGFLEGQAERDASRDDASPPTEDVHA
jgi:nitrate ABC transporter ATP-binding subunit